MDTGFDFSIIWSIFGALASLIIFGICVYYVIVKPGLDSILLVIGSFIRLITTLFYSVGTIILANMHGADFYSQRWIFNIIGAISFIGTICFTTGLIILIIGHVKAHKGLRDDQY